MRTLPVAGNRFGKKVPEQPIQNKRKHYASPSPQQGRAGLGINSEAYKGSEQCGLLGKVLARKNGHSLMEGFDVPPGSVLGGLSFVVDYGRRREVVVLPARLLNPKAQVDVFSVHKEVLIKSA